jgi:hypothetical protein
MAGDIIYVQSACNANPDADYCWGPGPDMLRDFVADALTDPDAPSWWDPFTTTVLPWNYDILSPPDPLGGPADWTVTGGRLVQSSNIHSYAGGGVSYPGTLVIQEHHGPRADGTVSVNLQSPDNDGAGIVFRYVDYDNYYRVSVDQQKHFVRLMKKQDGIYTTIAQKTDFYFSYSQFHTLAVEMSGPDMEVFWDGQSVLQGSDSTFGYGLVGLYSWANAGLTFDNFRTY